MMNVWCGSTRSAFTSPISVGERFCRGEGMRLMITAILGFTALALAQQPRLPPVQAKRLPPEKGKASDAAYLDHYDFGAQVVALQQPVSAQSGDGYKPATLPAPQPGNGVPAG